MKMFMMKRMMDMMLMPTHLKFWIWIPMITIVFWWLPGNQYANNLWGLFSILSPIILGLLISGALYFLRDRKFYQPMVTTMHLMVVIMPILVWLVYSYLYIGSNANQQNINYWTWIYLACLASFFMGYLIYGYNFNLANKRIKEFS